jgi:hypothetical protein
VIQTSQTREPHWTGGCHLADCNGQYHCTEVQPYVGH